MPEERSGKRRRRRRRRRGGAGGAEEQAESEPQGKTVPPLPDWRWRTFPVFFALVSGAFLMGLFGGYPGVGNVIFFIALGGVAFGLAHILTRQLIARWRR